MKNIDNPKQFAIDLLNKVIGKKDGNIVSLKPIHLGYTNQSFIATYSNGKKYQVRLPHCGDLINRSNEFKMLSLMKDKSFIYFDVKTGIGIKQWLPGKNPRIPTFWQWKQADNLFAEIKKIHAIPVPKGSKFQKINFDAYNQNLYHLKLAYQTKYLSIIQTYRDDKVVLSHTDINADNMIIDNNNKLHLIDFEWCGLASDYWDYANFIREARILWYPKIDWKKYIDKFDMQKLKDYIFVCSVFSYLWTWAMPQTKRIKKYRFRTLRQIKYYAKGVIVDDK